MNEWQPIEDLHEYGMPDEIKHFLDVILEQSDKILSMNAEIVRNLSRPAVMVSRSPSNDKEREEPQIVLNNCKRRLARLNIAMLA